MSVPPSALLQHQHTTRRLVCVAGAATTPQGVFTHKAADQKQTDGNTTAGSSVKGGGGRVGDVIFNCL